MHTSTTSGAVRARHARRGAVAGLLAVVSFLAGTAVGADPQPPQRRAALPRTARDGEYVGAIRAVDGDLVAVDVVTVGDTAPTDGSLFVHGGLVAEVFLAERGRSASDLVRITVRHGAIVAIQTTDLGVATTVRAVPVTDPQTDAD
jgi:hypothetical protein